MKNFKLFRNYFGLTQEQLADSLSLDKNTISFYEAGRATPSMKVLIKAAELYGISLDYFLLGKDCVYPRHLKFLQLALEVDKKAKPEGKSLLVNTVHPLINEKQIGKSLLKQDHIEIGLNDSFHQNLKALRLYKNLKQSDISEQLEVSPNLMAQYELKSYPPFERMLKLSEILEISVHALVTGVQLNFDFQDKSFGKTVTEADRAMNPKDLEFAVRLMETVLK